MSVSGGQGAETVVWKAGRGAAGANKGFVRPPTGGMPAEGGDPAGTVPAASGMVGITVGMVGLKAAVARMPMEGLATGAIITGLTGAATTAGVGAARGAAAATPTAAGALDIGVKRALVAAVLWAGEVGRLAGEVGRLKAELAKTGGSAGDNGGGASGLAARAGGGSGPKLDWRSAGREGIL